jgi:hypothetical protein
MDVMMVAMEARWQMRAGNGRLGVRNWFTPYKGVDGKCRYNANKIAAKITNFTNIPIDEDQMAA